MHKEYISLLSCTSVPLSAAVLMEHQAVSSQELLATENGKKEMSMDMEKRNVYHVYDNTVERSSNL